MPSKSPCDIDLVPDHTLGPRRGLTHHDETPPREQHCQCDANSAGELSPSPLLVKPLDFKLWTGPSPGLQRAARQGIGFHDLRHARATMLLKAGTPPHVVSRRLGHSTVAFTLQVYAHVLPGQQREAADAIEATLLGDVAAK